MENIITFKDAEYWDRLSSRRLCAGESRDIVKFHTKIGGVGETGYVYLRTASYGGCAVKINEKWAYRPIFDADGGLVLRSHELSGMFAPDSENSVELYVKGGSAVRAVFFFGGEDGRLSVLSTDEGWSAARSAYSFDGGREIFDGRGGDMEVLTPDISACDPPDRDDSPADEPNAAINPVKVFTDEKKLRRVYDFGGAFRGVPIITASLRRGEHVYAEGALTMPNLTLIRPEMFREGSKILICSGFGADRLYPLYGAEKFRYIYAYGDGADYVVTAAVKL